MFLMGDVHGKYKPFNRFLRKHEEETVIQLGDFGIGFAHNVQPNFGPNHFFLRGNHDNPAKCAKHPNHLGDWGYKEIEGKVVFWLAGAWSIDQDTRIEGKNWWRDEELSLLELYSALDKYTEIKPEIMLSHDCPSSVTEQMFSYSTSTRIGQALQAMFETYQPKFWFYGHYHQSFVKTINGTKFQCLKELETTEI